MLSTSAMNPVNRFMQPNSMADASDGASTQPETISANDFLTLLVTEMKNQDPTAQTDPNEYINQLVQVNSLEQLIQINQDLSAALESANDSENPVSSARKVETFNPADSVSAAKLSASKERNPGANQANHTNWNVQSLVALGSGNLGIPASRPAAHRVAQSLNGRM